MSVEPDGWSADLRQVFELVDQGFALCEMVLDERGTAVDYRFVYVNEWFTEMTGLVDPVGRTARELVPGLETHWVETYAHVAFDRQSLRFQQGSEAMGRWFDVFATPLDPPGRFAIVFRDETARRMAEEALSRSADRFRAMADDLPLMIWVHGPDGEQQFVNQTFCAYFGVERDEMVGDRWQPLLHPDDADQYVAAFADAVAGRHEFHARARVRDARGEWRWLESWARPRWDEHNRFTGLIGSSADVTERVRAEAALEEASAFLRRVLDSLFTFVGVLTPDGTVTEANRAPLDAAGLTFDDVLGKKFWDCFWWNYDPAVQARLAAAVERAAAGEIVRYDERIRVADDGWMWLDFQLVPLRDLQGAITHLIPSALDITERIELEHARAGLHRMEQQRRARAELLEENASRLAAAVSPDDAARAVLDHLEHAMGLACTMVHLVSRDTMATIAGPSLARDPIVTDRPDGPRLGVTDAPGTVALATNAPVLAGNPDDIGARFPRIAPLAARHGVQSLYALPLRTADGRALGALTVGARETSRFDAEHQVLLREIADQTGHALQRAMLHEQVVDAHRREHAVAVRLQRALLPDRLVADPRLPIAARYEAADTHLDVGGDWYDTYQWPDGHILLLVGDVVGHDLDAAAAMGRLRSATGALVTTLAPDPVAVLDALEHIALGPSGTRFVTSAAIVIDPATGTLTYATAGHPPPLLISAGEHRWLDDANSPPIGTIQVADRPVAATALRPGDLIILYTDGLVEHRQRPIDIGLDLLQVAAHELRETADLTRLIDGLLAGLVPGAVHDDIVTVAARWTPEHG